MSPVVLQRETACFARRDRVLTGETECLGRQNSMSGETKQQVWGYETVCFSVEIVCFAPQSLSFLKTKTPFSIFSESAIMLSGHRFRFVKESPMMFTVTFYGKRCRGNRFTITFYGKHYRENQFTITFYGKHRRENRFTITFYGKHCDADTQENCG